MSIFQPESHCDLLRDSGASPTRIPPFHFHNGSDELFRRSFGSRTTGAFRRKQQTIFSPSQHLVKMQQRGGLQHHGRTEKTCPANEKSAQTHDKAIPGSQIGCTLAATVQDQKLVPDQHGLSDHPTESSGLCQPDHGNDQMKQKDQEVAHFGNRTKIRQASDLTPHLEFAIDT